jgi:hypothetical protein
MPDFIVVCEDSQVVPEPVDDVLVRIFNEAGDTFITSGTTGAVVPGSGEVELTVPSDGTYRAKFSMAAPGYTVVTPQLLDVPVTDDAVFEITLDLFQLEPATDPELCRVSGHILRGNKRPAAGVELFFTSIAEPIIQGQSIILGKKVRVLSDDTGKVVVDLVRQGKFRVFVEGLEDIPTQVEVPDRAWTDIKDLLFPSVELVTFTPNPISMLVDDIQDVDVQFTYRSGLVRGPLELVWDDLSVSYSVSPTTGLLLGFLSTGQLRLRAQSAGTYTITPTITSNQVILPEPVVTGTLSVTVT